MVRRPFSHSPKDTASQSRTRAPRKGLLTGPPTRDNFRCGAGLNVVRKKGAVGRGQSSTVASQL